MRRGGKTVLYVCACALIGILLLLGITNNMWKQSQPQMKQRQVKLTEEPLPLQWQVNVTGRSEEVHHILFVKLNVLFPRAGRNILSERWRWPLARLSRHPPSPPFLFDIVCNHLVYDRRADRFLPEDVVRIAVLREPLSQVYSAFNYYRKVYREEYLKHPSSFRDFLSRQDHYENRGPYRSFTNNRMSLDLGLPLKQLKNSSHVKHFVKEVDDLFDLVLIAERFDESMILLKRRLKWTMKDVLYISINKGAKSQQRPPKLDQAIQKKFRKFDQFDNGLYDYFSQKFDKLVREEGQGFKDEVQVYKDILQQVSWYCNMKDLNPENVIFPQKTHTDKFELQFSECKTMTLGEMEIIERAQFWQDKRMYPVKTKTSVNSSLPQEIIS